MGKANDRLQAARRRALRGAMDLLASRPARSLGLRAAAKAGGLPLETLTRLYATPSALAKAAIVRALIDTACCLRTYRASQASLEQAVGDYAAFLAMVFGSRRYRALRAIVDREKGALPWIADAHRQCVIEPAACNLLNVMRRAGKGKEDPLFMERSELVRIVSFIERRALAEAGARDPANLASLTRAAIDYVRASLDSFAFIRSPAYAAPAAFPFPSAYGGGVPARHF